MEPEELIQPSPLTDAFTQRLAKYVEARDIYLRASAMSETASAIDPWIRSAAASADFAVAYDSVLAHARSQSRSGREQIRGARRLLERLREVRPERPEASELLRHLPSPSAARAAAS
jgi:hypothetical protein